MLHDGRPRIFVTVGTDHHPFDRLVQWIDDWMIEGGGAWHARVFVQSGNATPPRHAAWAKLVPHGEMQHHMRTTAAVVCHGGPASITECREAGVVPIVVPRNPTLGEHVDDHQLRFSRRMAALGKVRLAESSQELAALLDQAVSSSDAFRFTPGAEGVAHTVEEFDRVLTALLAERPARRRRLRTDAGAGR
jgi:UDP-N-acetylglucosamine transferase subunit ALG13